MLDHACLEQRVLESKKGGMDGWAPRDICRHGRDTLGQQGSERSGWGAGKWMRETEAGGEEDREAGTEVVEGSGGRGCSGCGNSDRKKRDLRIRSEISSSVCPWIAKETADTNHLNLTW